MTEEEKPEQKEPEQPEQVALIPSPVEVAFALHMLLDRVGLVTGLLYTWALCIILFACLPAVVAWFLIALLAISRIPYEFIKREEETKKRGRK